MNKADIDKLKSIIKDKQKEYEEDAGHDYWAQGWHEALQWALEGVEKLEITEEPESLKREVKELKDKLEIIEGYDDNFIVKLKIENKEFEDRITRLQNKLSDKNGLIRGLDAENEELKDKVKEPDAYDEYGRAIKYVDDGRGE